MKCLRSLSLFHAYTRLDSMHFQLGIQCGAAATCNHCQSRIGWRLERSDDEVITMNLSVHPGSASGITFPHCFRSKLARWSRLYDVIKETGASKIDYHVWCQAQAGVIPCIYPSMLSLPRSTSNWYINLVLI